MTDGDLGLLDVFWLSSKPEQASLTVIDRAQPGLTPACGLLREAVGGVGTLLGWPHSVASQLFGLLGVCHCPDLLLLSPPPSGSATAAGAC